MDGGDEFLEGAPAKPILNQFDDELFGGVIQGNI